MPQTRLRYANVVATMALVVAVAGNGPAVAGEFAQSAASLSSKVRNAVKLGKRADKRSKAALRKARKAQADATQALENSSNGYSKNQSDARFLPVGGKAADANFVDGLDSTAFGAPTAAFSTSSDSSHALGSELTSVLSKAVPAGKYVVFASTVVVNPTGTTQGGECEITAPTELHSQFINIPALSQLQISLLGTADLPSGATVTLSCFHSTGNGSALRPRLAAVRVDSIG